MENGKTIASLQIIYKIQNGPQVDLACGLWFLLAFAPILPSSPYPETNVSFLLLNISGDEREDLLITYLLILFFQAITLTFVQGPTLFLLSPPVSVPGAIPGPVLLRPEHLPL